MAHSKKTIEKIRKARTGTKHSAETIAKIKTTMMARAKLMKEGLLPKFKHTEKTKRLMRKKAKRRKFSKQARAASQTKLKAKGDKTRQLKKKNSGKKDYSTWLENN
jgi:hypothetical protein